MKCSSLSNRPCWRLRRDTLEKVQVGNEVTKQISQATAEHLEARQAYWDDKVKEKKETLALWTEMMNFLVSIETHGSKKLEDETWEHFIQQGLLQREVSGLPGSFKVNAKLPFHEAIFQITSHICQLQKEVKDAERKNKGVLQRKDSKVKKMERKEKRGKKKVAQILQAEAERPDKLNLGSSSRKGIGYTHVVNKDINKVNKKHLNRKTQGSV